MGALTQILRDAQHILFRNRDPHAIPPMDGALSPNDRLDRLKPVGAPIPEADDVIEGPDGALYVSCAAGVLRLSGSGFEQRSLFAAVDGRAGGLACCPDGTLLVCVAGRGVVAIDKAGRQSALREANGSPIVSATGVAAIGDLIFIAEGSTRHAPQEWCRDLMEKNHVGRLIASKVGFSRADVLAEGLAYPHGLAAARDGSELLVTESWAHRVRAVPIEAAQLGTFRNLMTNLAGYPARLGKGRGGGFWLSIFALRTHLIELVLREDDYRREMLAGIDPSQWVAPSLRSTGHYLEPLQAGGVKKLGIQKPWAPPRSYGLVVRIDEDGQPIESLHSRVGGHYHGITGACETEQGLVVVSKGDGRLLIEHRGVAQ